MSSHVSFVSNDVLLPGQEERQYAIKSFKSGAKDVMVASSVASKGLDFNDIQHVIIFSMPKEIEDYVHQIGRTGRSGKTGIATCFVNMNTPEQTLLDLKYLLMEAGQKYVPRVYLSACPRINDYLHRVPPFLLSIEDPRAAQGGSLKGCPVCGGNFDSSDYSTLTDCSYRPWTWDIELSETGGCSAETNGVASCCRRWRRGILRMYIYCYLCIIFFLTLYCFRIRRF